MSNVKDVKAHLAEWGEFLGALHSRFLAYAKSAAVTLGGINVRYFPAVPPSGGVSAEGATTWAQFPPSRDVKKRELTAGGKMSMQSPGGGEVIPISDDESYTIFISPLKYATNEARLKGEARETAHFFADVIQAWASILGGGKIGEDYQTIAKSLGLVAGPGKPGKDSEGNATKGRENWRKPTFTPTAWAAIRAAVKDVGNPPAELNLLSFVRQGVYRIEDLTRFPFHCPTFTAEPHTQTVSLSREGCDFSKADQGKITAKGIILKCAIHERDFVLNMDAVNKLLEGNLQKTALYDSKAAEVLKAGARLRKDGTPRRDYTGKTTKSAKVKDAMAKVKEAIAKDQTEAGEMPARDTDKAAS